jgi:hypothetical protein
MTERAAQTAAPAVADSGRIVHNAKTRPNGSGWDGSVTEPNSPERGCGYQEVDDLVLAHLSPAGKRGLP